MAATEAMLDCCELEGAEGVVCAANIPPTTCVVECAEIWEPLVEDCEEHLQDFQQFTAECALVPRGARLKRRAWSQGRWLIQWQSLWLWQWLSLSLSQAGCMAVHGPLLVGGCTPTRT